MLVLLMNVCKRHTTCSLTVHGGVPPPPAAPEILALDEADQLTHGHGLVMLSEEHERCARAGFPSQCGGPLLVQWPMSWNCARQAVG